MKTDEIKALFEDFQQAASQYEGVECWSALQLQSLLGYAKWENLAKVIDKAKEAYHNAGQKIADHFPDLGKVIEADIKAIENETDGLLNLILGE